MDHSPLNKIPAELRLKVYEEVVTVEHGVYLMSRSVHDSVGTRSGFDFTVNKAYRPFGREPVGDLLAITKTCRGIRREVGTLFFTMNHFHLDLAFGPTLSDFARWTTRFNPASTIRQLSLVLDVARLNNEMMRFQTSSSRQVTHIWPSLTQLKHPITASVISRYHFTPGDECFHDLPAHATYRIGRLIHLLNAPWILNLRNVNDTMDEMRVIRDRVAEVEDLLRAVVQYGGIESAILFKLSQQKFHHAKLGRFILARLASGE